MKHASFVAVIVLSAISAASSSSAASLAVCTTEPCYEPIIGFGGDAESAQLNCYSQDCGDACSYGTCETPNYYGSECSPGFWSGIGDLWVSEGYCTCIPDPR